MSVGVCVYDIVFVCCACAHELCGRKTPKQQPLKNKQTKQRNKRRRKSKKERARKSKKERKKERKCVCVCEREREREREKERKKERERENFERKHSKAQNVEHARTGKTGPEKLSETRPPTFSLERIGFLLMIGEVLSEDGADGRDSHLKLAWSGTSHDPDLKLAAEPRGTFNHFDDVVAIGTARSSRS